MKIRIAFLGAAHVHAQHYAALLSQREDTEVLGFTEDDPNVAQEFAQRTGLMQRTAAEIMALSPHGVIVCTVNTKRLGPVQLAAASGAHVLCEKPIATNEADAQAMRRACEAAGVQFVTAFPARFSSAALSLAEQLRAGQLGKVLAYSGVNHSVAPDHEQPWFGDPSQAGGGAGMDHIVHLADLLRFVGERPTEVYAQLRPVPQWVLPEHADIDAAGLITLRLASGASATIDCSWSRPQGYPRWGQLRLDVTASRGMLSLDVFADHLNVTQGTYQWAGYGEDLNAKMLDDFIQVCAGSGAGRATWQDGYAALRVVQAAYASNASGEAVRLDDAAE
ncbi:Gfo/Idh/MocA family oxidoreductase [Deinococcus detaillensis]|uniref:Gfo/Idh/MocA family oxidoreductase n=1 Tax=Deinococcus detaillensis TaxID=2592048 RepID=A0A553UJJ5_9DEIO|nr:Gfo/Idh/MocA family oxidoreductase [Deinococcus detaillensis]TSA80360.1 Gfo/Idh/MocA family oxidoreductase [Deinococcus detaillensis]